MGRTLAVIVLVVATLTSPVVGFVGGAASTPTTLTVDDDGPADYPSVSAAVENAAPGTIIEVAPGTYAESVIVDKPGLTIRGDPGDGTAGAGPDAPTMTGTGVAFILTGAADGVTLTGFDVEDGYTEAVLMRPAATKTLEGVTVSQHTLAAELGVDATVGGVSLTDIRLSGNDLTDTAVHVDGDGASSLALDGLTVEDNRLSTSDLWVELDDVDDLSVTGLNLDDNLVTGADIDVELDGSPAYSLTDASVTGNRLDGSPSDAIALELDATGSHGTLTVSRNEITDSDNDGVEFELATDATYRITVADNVVEGADDEGIEFLDTGGAGMAVIVRGNEIRNNLGSGIRVDDDGDVTGVIVRENVISGNQIGVENDDETAILDARQNYWGDSEGPSGSLEGETGGEPIVLNVQATRAAPPVVTQRLYRASPVAGTLTSALQETFLLDPVSGTPADGSGDRITIGFFERETEEPVSNVRFDPFLTAPPDENDEDTGPKAFPSPRFVVTEASVNRTAPHAGQPVGVTIEVTNEGTADGNYDLHLFDNDESLRSDRVHLGEGESHTFEYTLRWNETGARDLQTHEKYVARLKIQEPLVPVLGPSAVEVVDATVDRSRVLSGERYAVVAHVRNDANRTGKLPVLFRADGRVVANRTTELEPNGTAVVRYTASTGPNATAPATGTVNWTVAGATAGNLTVSPEAEVSTGLVDAYGPPMPVAPGAMHPVSAVLYNADTTPQMVAVTVRRNGTAMGSGPVRFVRLAPGEVRTVTMTVTAGTNATTTEWVVTGGNTTRTVTTAAGG